MNLLCCLRESHTCVRLHVCDGLCMTTRESSLLVEESSIAMDANAPASKPKKIRTTGESNKIRAGDDDDRGEEGVERDVQAWGMMSKTFKQVQAVLDQNRELIQQVNANHHSKIPDDLIKNVSLIRDINGNISKVMSIYSDLSVNFSNAVQDRRRVQNEEGNVESNAD